MHDKTVNQIVDGHISTKKLIFGFFKCLRLRDLLNLGRKKNCFLKKVQNDMTINYLSI